MRSASSSRIRSSWPSVSSRGPAWADAELASRWQRLLEVREAAQKRLEEKRAAKEIGSSLEAAVTLRAGGGLYELLEADRQMLEDLLIVSAVDLERGDAEGLEVSVRRAEGPKCERCWHYRTTVGIDAALPTVCGKCVGHLNEGWPELATA